MATIRLLLGARLRARWRTILALALVGGIALGASAAAIAIARHTETAYRRIADSAEAVHYEFATSVSPAEFDDLLAATPDHGLGDVRQWVGFVDAYNSYGFLVDSLGPWGRAMMEEAHVFDGRLPVKADEVFVFDEFSERAGLGVGDRITRGILTSDFQDVVDFEFEITAVGTMVAEFGVPDDTLRTPVIVMSSAFVQQNPHLVGWYSAGAIVDTPPTRAEVAARLDRARTRFDTDIEFVAEGLSRDKERAARHALRPAVTALYVVGFLGLIGTAAILAFTVGRELTAWSPERSTLRALGASPALRRGIDGSYVVACMAAIAAVAAATYIAVTPLGPMGELRQFDPDRGPVFDARAITLAAMALLAAGAMATVLPSEGRARPVSVPTNDVAIRLLAGTTTASRRSLVLGVVLGVVGLAASAAVLPYVSSLGALVDDPARFGQPWDAMVRNRWGNQAPDAIAEVAESDLTSAVATISHTNVQAVGHGEMPAAAYEVIEGPDLMTIVTGRGIDATTDVVLGGVTLDRLDLTVGDVIEIRPGTAISFTGVPAIEGARADVTIVGEAIFPTLSLPGADVPRLGEGIAISRTLFKQMTQPGDEPEVTLVATDSHADLVALQATFPDIRETTPLTYGSRWFLDPQPAEIRNAEQVLPVLWSGLAVLTLSSAAVLGLATRAMLRTQRKDLAVLRAIGASARQIRAIAWKQGLAMAAPLALFGIPIGFAVGRLLYARLATDMGVSASPSLPVLAIFAFVVVTAGCCSIAIIVAARNVQRIPPALSLRAI